MEGKIAKVCSAFGVPFGTEALSASEPRRRHKKFDAEYYQARDYYWISTLQEVLASINSDDFRQYVSLDQDDENLSMALRDSIWRIGLAVGRAGDRYERARYLYDRTYALLHYIEQRSKRPDVYLHLTGRDTFFSSQAMVVGSVLHFKPDIFTEAFNGVDITRLGRCRFCRKVFWRRRMGSNGCTDGCAAALRTRRWRHNLTPGKKREYKVNRIMKELSKGE